MKNLDEIKKHLSTTSYAYRARIAIRYWLLGKDLITSDTEIEFKRTQFSNGSSLERGNNFDDFLKWYNTIEFGGTIESNINISLAVGDYVKVYDDENPRDEFVDAITIVDDNIVVLLSDGTWVPWNSVGRYKVQGAERAALISKLTEVEE